MTLRVVPLELSEANRLVAAWHRHHKPVQGHRFSLGCYDDKEHRIVGAVIVGRPVARLVDHRSTLEVTRLVTDGTRNACSVLYAAAARVGREMGYLKIQTYILDVEEGTSLKAAGWVCEEGAAGGGQWKHTDGRPRRIDQPTCSKKRWAKHLNDRRGGFMSSLGELPSKVGDWVPIPMNFGPVIADNDPAETAP